MKKIKTADEYLKPHKLYLSALNFKTNKCTYAGAIEAIQQAQLDMINRFEELAKEKVCNNSLSNKSVECIAEQLRKEIE